MLPSEFVKDQKACIYKIVVFAVAIIIQSFASILFPQIVQQLNEPFPSFYTVSLSFSFSILGVCMKMNDNYDRIEKESNQK